MFMISKKNCPHCGKSGRLNRNEPGIRTCQYCGAVFSEFGIVSMGEKPEVSFA